MRIPATLLGLVLAASCSAPSSSSSAPSESSDSYVSAADGKLLHYRVRGSGDSVLLLPGGSWMLEDLGPLTKRHRVVSYDLRGRGRSDAVPLERPPTLAEDLADLEQVVQWFGLERFSILAIDYQAALAAIYADRHPEKVERIVMVSPMPIRKDPYDAIYERVFSGRLDSRDFAELREMAKLLVHRREPERWAAAYKKALFTGWVADAKSLARMKSMPFVEPNLDPERAVKLYTGVRRGLGDWDFRKELADIETPVLVIYGSQDPVPERSSLEWSTTLPNGAAERIEGSGRMPWFEEPQRFFSLVESWLAAQPGA